MSKFHLLETVNVIQFTWNPPGKLVVLQIPWAQREKRHSRLSSELSYWSIHLSWYFFQYLCQTSTFLISVRCSVYLRYTYRSSRSSLARTSIWPVNWLLSRFLDIFLKRSTIIPWSKEGIEEKLIHSIKFSCLTVSWCLWGTGNSGADYLRSGWKRDPWWHKYGLSEEN